MLPNGLRWRQTQAAYVGWADKPLSEDYMSLIRSRGDAFSEFVGEPGVIIDVGCGNGVIGGMTYEQSGYIPIHKGKHLIYGVDPLPLKAPVPWVNFYAQTRCEDIDETNIHADVATFVTSFDHLESPPICLAKLRKIGVKALYLWETLWVQPAPADWYHSCRYTYQEFVSILTDAGFRITQSVQVSSSPETEEWFIEATLK